MCSIMMIKGTSVAALTEALERYMPEVVGALAKEYDFDQEAGLKMLGKLSVQKEGKSRGVKTKRVVPKIIVPFCGIVQDDWCKAVRYNRGLFTQCTNACKKDSKFCTTCLKHVSVDGIPQYGLIEERGNEGWTDPNGKVPVNYGNIISKIGVTKEQAIAEAEKLGWTIPEEQFEVVKTRKGRPAKKAKEADEKPKKRGRPKKSKPVVEGAGTGDDLIAQLVQQAQQQNEVVAAEETEDEEEAETPTTLVDFGSSSEEEEAAPEVEPTQSPAEQTEDEAVEETEDEESPAEQTEDEAVEKKPKKVTRKKKTAEEKEAEKLAKAEAKAKLADQKKAAKEAEKLAKADAKAKLAAENKAIKEAKKKATMLAKAEAKAEAKKLAKAEAEKLAKAEAEKLETEEEKVEEVVEELGELTIEEAVEEEEEEDAVEVIKFTHEGVEYLRDADGTVYDMESQEEIGEWDDESNTITFA